MAARVRIEWFGDERIAQVEAAADMALAAAAELVGTEVRKTLKRTTGRVIKEAGQRNAYTASMPGTPPNWRSGRLAGSIRSEKAGFLTYRVGTNLEYARIHELGGTINAKGGRPYIVTGEGAVFIGDAKANELRSRGYWVGKTRPHTIRMPKRPYLVPTLKRLAADGSIQKRFATRFKANMKGVA